MEVKFYYIHALWREHTIGFNGPHMLCKCNMLLKWLLIWIARNSGLVNLSWRSDKFPRKPGKMFMPRVLYIYSM